MNGQRWLAMLRGKQGGIASSLLRVALLPASVAYGLVMCLRNGMYDIGVFRSYRVDVPVVVVGNLTVGGTGKTPVVEYLARFYRQHDRQVTILSRGYGTEQGRNDEALVLESNLLDVPHLQSPDRVKLARIAIEELESDLLILDDGFQHRRLARDLDVVLIDATEPWGLGYLLPRGLLREPKSALKRAGVIIITRSDQVDSNQLIALQQEIARRTTTPIAHACHAPQSLCNLDQTESLVSLQGRKVAAFCGIGNPAGFWRTLTDLGCTLIEHRDLPDHFAYPREAVVELQEWARKLPDDCWLITTQKDWVKLRVNELGGKPLWALPIALEITHGQAELQSALLQVLRSESRESSASISVVSSLPHSSKDAYDSATACPI